MGIDPNRNTKGSSQAKVCQFDNSLVVDQEVLGLQVPVEDSSTVTEVNALQYLVKVALKGGKERMEETDMFEVLNGKKKTNDMLTSLNGNGSHIF